MPSSPLTIYLAEDHVAIRELLVGHLKMLPGYAVVAKPTMGGKSWMTASA